ncbi:MAG: CYTH domain-containing protein, partial [Bradyrhizobium sp.]|nr:CYTH domain-containing protein [Bradyrhizobium sp.]
MPDSNAASIQGSDRVMPGSSVQDATSSNADCTADPPSGIAPSRRIDTAGQPVSLAADSEAADPAAADAGAAPLDPARPALPDPAISGEEIELKLLVVPEQLADFNNAPIVVAHARNKGTRKHLTSVYYDTPRRQLWKNGFTLRVRQSGSRFVQTVKSQQSDDPLKRGEWEASVTSLAPDTALAAALLPEELRAAVTDSPLEPVFTADVHRHARLLDLPNATLEVAFDSGVIKAGEHSE